MAVDGAVAAGQKVGEGVGFNHVDTALIGFGGDCQEMFSQDVDVAALRAAQRSGESAKE